MSNQYVVNFGSFFGLFWPKSPTNGSSPPRVQFDRADDASAPWDIYIRSVGGRSLG